MKWEIELKNPDEALTLFGNNDKNLRLLKDRFKIQVVARNERLQLEGPEEPVGEASELVSRIVDDLRTGAEPSADAVEEKFRKALLEVPDIEPPDYRRIDGFKPRTPGQASYLDMIQRKDVVFAIGPAGTGKTFLAVLMAVHFLKAGAIQRLILTRPAVEAGEKLGFLPGDLQAKVNPYLRPLYDALYEILGVETVKRFLERDIIEVAPLAYMRGRTLNRAAIILDEAQNTTSSQMKMFLTRMGEGSKMVVTGDDTQIDIPRGRTSGLIHVQKVLKGVKGIGFHHMTVEDIVRHRLVWDIVNAYESHEGKATRRKKRRVVRS